MKKYQKVRKIYRPISRKKTKDTEIEWWRLEEDIARKTNIEIQNNTTKYVEI